MQLLKSAISDINICVYFMLRYGAIGLLYTQPDYRGRGLIRPIVRALSNQLIDVAGVRPFAYAETYNAASIKMLSKMGFNQHDVSWVGTGQKKAE